MRTRPRSPRNSCALPRYTDDDGRSFDGAEVSADVMPPPPASRRAFAAFVVVAVLGLVLSGIGPRHRATWWLEVLPVVIALPLLAFTRTRFPLTWLVYVLVAVHAAILMLGGHYTYAEVPLGYWVRDTFDLSRNHYDRLGHFAQGFVPAIVAREILLRRTPLVRGAWLAFLTVATCLAISASYEFLEWWTALIAGAEADAFLATQGDVWDTQWDMLLATIGAVTALLALSRVHDRALVGLAVAERRAKQ
jgi:putative membrane protein